MNRIALWTLALFVLSIPTENVVPIAGLGSLSRLVGIAAFGMAIVSLYDDGRLRLRTPSLFILLSMAFVVWIAATYFWSVAPNRTISLTIQFGQLVVLAWTIHQVASTQRDLDLLMQVYVVGCYVAIAHALLAGGGLSGAAFRDVGDLGINSFAREVALAIPMAWMLMVRRAFPLMQGLNLAFPLFAMLGVTLASSRGGLITALVALAVIPLTLPSLRTWQRLTLFAAVAAVAWAGFTWVPRAVPELGRSIERLAGTADELTEGTLTGRTTIWAAGSEVFATSPIVGVGMGGFGAAAQPIHGRARAVAAHNAFLSVAVGSGLIGLMLFLALFAVSIVGLMANPTRDAVYLVLLAALIVGLMPSNAENDKSTWFILAILASARPVLIHVVDHVNPRHRRQLSRSGRLHTQPTKDATR